MKIIVIIVTYNGSKWVEKCFSSLIKSFIPLKIIAIDNGSTDGTPDKIRGEFPQVEVIETSENLGFGKANNIGLIKVLEERADFAFLLNQDAWIEPDTVKKLVDVANENHNLGVISPVHLNGKGDAIDYYFEGYLATKTPSRFLSDAFLGKLKEFYISNYANAAAWLITLKCIETIGGFNPLFRHYGEDDDYIFRLKKADLELAIVPSAIIYHDRPQLRDKNEKFYHNQIYMKALFAMATQPKYHFLYRKIIGNYFQLYFVYFGNNKETRHKIKIDLETLKLKRKLVNIKENPFGINIPL